MRCKNCGADNDDNRYICEVCGSPLYDEDDFNGANDNINDDKTQTFKAVNDNDRQNQDDDYDDYDERRANNGDGNDKNNKNKNTEKKSILIIVILAVILIAIIASVVAIAHNKNKDNASTSSQLTKISSDASSTSGKYSTTKESTTESTSQSTTEKTTKQTTASLWIINTSSSGGGEAEGDGKYENGKKVTLIARADDGYKFDGWYSNGVKVSGSEEYTFTANQNASFSAVFSPVETQAPDTQPATSGDIVFGE